MIDASEEAEIRRLARSLLKHAGLQVWQLALRLRRNAVRRRGKYGHVPRHEYEPHRWGRKPNPSRRIDAIVVGDYVKTCNSHGASSKRWREVRDVVRNERGTVSRVVLDGIGKRGPVTVRRCLILNSIPAAEAPAR